MKYIFTILASFIFIGVLSAQNASTQTVIGPKIKFEKVQHNFGEIVEGQYAVYKFKFYNIGDKPLVLKNVRPGCGCTASDYPREPIMPGDSSSITARFNSRGYGGRNFHKSISVTTNMGENNMKMLYIKGNVVAKQPAVKAEDQSPVRVNNN